jgi:hypothetical protein
MFGSSEFVIIASASTIVHAGGARASPLVLRGDRNPRTRYAVGKDSVRLALLACCLPEKFFDLAILKKCGLPMAFGQPVT